jgi:hypothetical protein
MAGVGICMCGAVAELGEAESEQWNFLGPYMNDCCFQYAIEPVFTGALHDHGFGEGCDDWKADGSVRRKGYRGVWDIEVLVIEEGSHSFRLGQRYQPSATYSSR